MDWLDDIRRDLHHGHTHRHHHHRQRLQAEIEALERQLAAARASQHTDAAHLETHLAEITSLLTQLVVGIPATGFDVTQLPEGDPAMPITGVALGGSGVFKAATAPAGSSLLPGTSPQFSTGDAAVALTPSPDGDATKVVVTLAAAHDAPTFGITVSGVNSAGVSISTNFDIPVVQPVIPASGFTLDQLS